MSIIIPVIKYRGLAKAIGAGLWTFIGIRAYEDGPHHFLHHHSWSEPKAIAYLEKVDAKYGTSLATDNQHHH